MSLFVTIWCRLQKVLKSGSRFFAHFTSTWRSFCLNRLPWTVPPLQRWQIPREQVPLLVTLKSFKECTPNYFWQVFSFFTYFTIGQIFISTGRPFCPIRLTWIGPLLNRVIQSLVISPFTWNYLYRRTNCFVRSITINQNYKRPEKLSIRLCVIFNQHWGNCIFEEQCSQCYISKFF